MSGGTLGFDASGGARVGVLPVDGTRAIAMALVAAVVLAIGIARARGRAVAVAVSPLLLLLLPWLPFRVPASWLLWSGGLVTLVWMAAAAGLIAVVRPERIAAAAMSVPMQARAAAVLSACIFAFAAWQVSPTVPGGDEPHYLVIAQSLLRDGDIKIENNHRRGDYREYFRSDLPPDFLRRGRNGEIYSIHAPGIPALVLPAFALGGYRAVVVFLIAVAASAAGLLWWLAWRVTASTSAAWFGWAAAALSAPYVLETFTIYPDGLGAAMVLTGFWAMLRPDWERERQQTSWQPWVLHGLALATLPWMHTRFSVLAATIGGLALIRLSVAPNAVTKAIAFLTAPALGAVAWLWFFLLIYGTPDPSAPYGGQVQNSFAFLPNGLAGLLFDQGFGLVANAPVLVVALVGLGRVRRFAVQWLIVAAPYVLAVTTFAMWWAGWSAPARFFVPVLLPLGIPAAAAWVAMRSRGLRAFALALLAVSLWLSAVLVIAGGGRFAFHGRNEGGATAAPWAEWASHTVDLAAALPAFVPLPAGTATAARSAAVQQGLLTLLPWLAGAALALVAMWTLARRRLRDTVDLVAATALVFALTAMAVVALAWTIRRTDPITASLARLDLLGALSDGRVVAVDLQARRRIARDDLISRMRIDIPVAGVARGGGRANRPLATLASIPAGDYRLSVRSRAGDGWIMAGVGTDRDPFALITEPAAALASGRVLRLPVGVRALVVRADEGARRQVDGVELQPLRVLRGDEKPVDGYAGRAVRYGRVSAFFMDDGAYAEPAAFWVAGSRTTTVVLLQDTASTAQPVRLRNAPVDNLVSLASGSWHQDLQMAAGEERRVEVPVAPSRGLAVLRIGSKAGFRPADIDPTSRDTRVLGVYVTVQ